MTRFHRWSFVCLTFLGLFAVGCKQDNGERCEQPSDCSSGICGSDTTGGMTSAMGKICQATIGTPSVRSDASATDATANTSDAGEASDTMTSDGSGTPSTETGHASDAGGSDEVAAETGGDASVDGSADVTSGG